jgi:EpsI family protein
VGQSYWHDLAGLFLFASGFAMLTGLDGLLFRLRPKRQVEPDEMPAEGACRPKAAARGWGRSLAVSLILLLAALSATLLAPTRLLAEQRQVPDLKSLVPQSFGDWTLDTAADVLLVSPELVTNTQRLYGQTLARTYIDTRGQRVMLSIAYGGNQLGNELQAHRPEYCYLAQGFTLLDTRDGTVATTTGQMAVRRLIARQGSRIEPVTYWMTVGETTALPGLRRKLAQLRYGLRGQIPDGLLVRVSSFASDVDRAFGLHEAFIADLERALPDPLRFIIAGTPSFASSALPMR